MRAFHSRGFSTSLFTYLLFLKEAALVSLCVLLTPTFTFLAETGVSFLWLEAGGKQEGEALFLVIVCLSVVKSWGVYTPDNQGKDTELIREL